MTEKWFNSKNIISKMPEEFFIIFRDGNNLDNFTGV